jgi:RNA-directed DNA polymerase
VSKKYVLKIDLLKFFDSITEYRVSKVFEDIGYARNVAIDLARLTTVPLHEDYYDTFAPKDQKVFKKYFEKEIGVLPQGAPTKKDCSYTRYADDLTFSTDKAGSIPKKGELIDIIKSERLYVNFHKIHLYPQGKQRTVTGLTITNGLHVPKVYRKCALPKIQTS